RHFLQRNGHLNVAGQIGIVELVRVAQAFVGNELEVFPAEGMSLAGRKVPEGHLELAAYFRLQMMHCAGKTVGWEPFRQRVCFEERAIDFLRPGCQNTVQANSVGHHPVSFWYDESAPRRLRSESSQSPPMAEPNQGTIGTAVPRHASDGFRRIGAGSIARIPSILDR